MLIVVAAQYDVIWFHCVVRILCVARLTESTGASNDVRICVTVFATWKLNGPYFIRSISFLFLCLSLCFVTFSLSFLFLLSLHHFLLCILIRDMHRLEFFTSWYYKRFHIFVTHLKRGFNHEMNIRNNFKRLRTKVRNSIFIFITERKELCYHDVTWIQLGPFNKNFTMHLSSYRQYFCFTPRKHNDICIVSILLCIAMCYYCMAVNTTSSK
jgi:hypothetical protein